MNMSTQPKTYEVFTRKVKVMRHVLSSLKLKMLEEFLITYLWNCPSDPLPPPPTEKEK